MTTAISAPTRRPHASVIAATALLVVSIVASLFFGISWLLAANDDSIGYAGARDTALAQGRSEIVNFTSLDYRDVQRGLDLWLASSTGTLHDEVQRGRNDYASWVRQHQSVTVGKVLDAGIVELDQRTGKASVIAVVQRTITLGNQQPTVQRDRYQAELTREGTTWKLSGLSTVPVG